MKFLNGFLFVILLLFSACGKEDVITHEKMKNLDVMEVCCSQIVKGQMFGINGLARFATDARLGVDLQNAEYVWNDATRSVVISLPQPVMHDARVDEFSNENRWYELSAKWYAPFPETGKNKLVAEMKKTAQNHMEKICADDDLVNDVRRQTETCLKAFHRGHGYTAEIRWK